MSRTLTIRLSIQDRTTLEDAARKHGTGLSAFIRDLAEAEARRLTREAIRAAGDRVVSYLENHPQAQDEIDTYGTRSAICREPARSGVDRSRRLAQRFRS